MGSRKEVAQESYIVQQMLDDPNLRYALQELCQLLCTSVGPHGHIKSIQNSVGGPISMTTSSSRLLSAISFSQPCLRLITTAVQGHLQTYHDGGLLAGSLCLQLIQNAIEMEDFGRKCMREIYEVLLNIVDEYLNSDECPVSVFVDISDMKVMLAYVRSIITAKPVCDLRTSTVAHMSQIILKAFLISVPDTPKSLFSDRIFTLQYEKTDIQTSKVMEGLLLEWSERSVLLGVQELQLIRGPSKKVKVALICVSMSGDAEEILTNVAEAQYAVTSSAVELVLSKMIAFCDWLHDHQVGLVLCQKVIHPKVKMHLRQKGVLFIDRLGIQPVGYIQDITGAGIISSVMDIPSESILGLLDNAEHFIFHSKAYLHLQKTGSCVCTLLLCGIFDEQLSEVKSVVQSAVKGLYSVFQHPQLLCGGGCWQMNMAHYLLSVVTKRESELCAELCVTKTQLRVAVNAFVSSVESTARSLLNSYFRPWIDTCHWHIWHVPQGVSITMETLPFSCACGMFMNTDVDINCLQPLLKKEKPLLWSNCGQDDGLDAQKGPLLVPSQVKADWLVLDTKECVQSALHTAVLTACTVLSIQHYIHDVN